MGLRIQIHRDRDRIKIFSDSGFDITKRFPLKTKALTAVKDPWLFILDSEIEMWIEGKHQPREVTAGYLGAKEPPDDKDFIFNIFGCLAWGGTLPRNLVEEIEFALAKGIQTWKERYFQDWPPKFSRERAEVEYRDLHKLPYQVRRKIVLCLPFKQSTIGKPDTSLHFNIVPSYRVDNLEDAKKYLIKVSDSPASEGAMVKQAYAIYPLNNLTTEIQKLKLFAEVHGIVWKVNKTKTPGIFTVDYALGIDPGLKVPEEEIVVIAGKQYVNAGRTFPTKSKPKIGDVITVRFHTLNVYEDPETGLIDIEVYEPALTEIRGPKEKPDSIKSAIRIAEEAKLITRKPMKSEHGELEFIEDIEAYNPAKLRAKQLADDFRIVCAWYATWKDPEKEIKFTKEEIVNTAIRVAKEIVKRVKADKMKHVFEYWKMKPPSKELFMLIYKKAGIPEEMIEWEEPKKEIKREAEYLEFFPEDQKYARVTQAHLRGRTGHWDMRFEAGAKKDYLLGWTLFTMIRGKIKKPPSTMKEGRKIALDPDVWKIHPVTGEFKKRITRGGAIKEVSIMSRMKAPEPCLVRGSLVWTSNGLKPIERIAVGEEVLDANGKWTKVIANNRINLESSFLKRMKAKYGISTIYTPYHPILTKEGFIEVGDLSKGEEVLFPIVTLDNSIEEIFYQQYDQCGLYCSFRHIKLSYDLGYFFGMFAGDGNFNSSNITFSVSKNKEKLEEVIERLELRNSGLKRVSDGNYWMISVHDTKLTMLMKSLLLGGNKDQFSNFKFLPPGFLSRTNKNFLRGYVDGFIDADGSHTERGVKLTQSNLFSLSSFIFANILLGNLLNFTEYTYDKFGKKRVIFQTSKIDRRRWVDRIFNHCWVLPIRQIEDVSGRKKVKAHEQLYKYVYNLQTESETFCTMNVATHNTVWLTYEGVRKPGEITACLAPGVRILTTEGLKKIEKMKVGDLVYTHNRRWKKVLDVLVTIDEQRKCYKISGNSMETIIATADHPFLVMERKYPFKQYGEVKWMTAEKLYEESLNNSKFSEEYRFVIPYPETGEIGTYEEGLIVGHVIGDGMVRDDRISLYFNAKSDGKLARYYEHILKTLGYETSFDEIEKNILKFSFLSSDIKAKVIELKENPLSIQKYSREYIEGVFEGLLDADGYEMSICQKKPEVNRLIPILILYAGYAFREYKDERTGCSVWYTNKRTSGSYEEIKDISFKLLNSNKFKTKEHVERYGLKSFKIEETETPPRTYNLTVEDDESYFIPNLISHNTKMYHGVMVVIDDPRETRTQYLAQTTRLHEYWFSGGIFKGRSEGRYLFRIMIGMFRSLNFQPEEFSLEDDGDLWFVDTGKGLDIFLSRDGKLPEDAEDIVYFDPEPSMENKEIWRSLEEAIGKGKAYIKRGSFEILLQKKLLPPGEEEEIPGPAWLLIHAIDPIPYVISGRAESLEWMPPLGISALPEHVRKQIPPELRYWKKEIHQGKIEKADKIRRQIVDELKRKTLKIEFTRSLEIEQKVGSGRFTLHYQTWKGPSPVRLGPSRFEYNIRIQVDKQFMVIHCFSDPTKAKPVAAIYESPKEGYLDLSGAVKPGHPLNPTKETPSFIEIIDKGKVVVLEDLRDWKKFEFRGKILKGLFVMDREKGMPIWEFRVSRGPEERI